MYSPLLNKFSLYWVTIAVFELRWLHKASFLHVCLSLTTAENYIYLNESFTVSLYIAYKSLCLHWVRLQFDVNFSAQFGVSTSVLKSNVGHPVATGGTKDTFSQTAHAYADTGWWHGVDTLTTYLWVWVNTNEH